MLIAILNTLKSVSLVSQEANIRLEEPAGQLAMDVLKLVSLKLTSLGWASVFALKVTYAQLVV